MRLVRLGDSLALLLVLASHITGLHYTAGRIAWLENIGKKHRVLVECGHVFMNSKCYLGNSFQYIIYI